VQHVLIDGQWRVSQASGSFRAENPATKSPLEAEYPISTWADCDAALAAAQRAALQLRALPADQIAAFLDDFAARIESHREALVALAHAETGLPKSPRLNDAELPRTTNQLRQAAAAAREGSWAMATIDTKENLRSCLAPVGPVCVFGPNNFPFAFNSAAGGDFAAAIAAGNPVIAKANSSHPGTTKLLAELAFEAVNATGLPPATVQLIYRTNHADGERLVSDPRVGATGYTGSRDAGLKLKAAADRAGKLIYLELSSVNPVVVLPGAVQERGEEIAGQFVASCLMGTGQFCTNPGLVVLIRDAGMEQFAASVAEKFKAAPVGTLLSKAVAAGLQRGLETLQRAGAKVVVGEGTADEARYCHPNTLLTVSGQEFLLAPHELQTEAFGNATLFVITDDLNQACAVLDELEGNLTGAVYSANNGSDDISYDRVALHLRYKVGRLLNDKMPTGVAVSPAMNHGGPYPATGHPGFTAVGIPASMHRFAVLQSFDNVRPHRLPGLLRDKNPGGRAWRLVDGAWSQADVPSR
jgi:alpha-ketoglutaric semialdehyde dehydrogenase